MSLVRSKQRVAAHGEVFTPDWLVQAMLDLMKHETERIDSRFLEPACGSGNFLVPVLTRKLAVVQARYGKAEFERSHYALLALMSVYGIELLQDNVDECRLNMLEIFDQFLRVGRGDTYHRAAGFVLSQNVVHGDAVTMLRADRTPIVFPEWSYLGRGKFQRRDFRFDVMTQMSAIGAEDSLFGDLGQHEVFTPVEDYKPMTAEELAT